MSPSLSYSFKSKLHNLWAVYLREHTYKVQYKKACGQVFALTNQFINIDNHVKKSFPCQNHYFNMEKSKSENPNEIGQKSNQSIQGKNKEGHRKDNSKRKTLNSATANNKN